METFLLLTVIASFILCHKSITKLIASTLDFHKEHSYFSVIYIFYLTYVLCVADDVLMPCLHFLGLPWRSPVDSSYICQNLHASLCLRVLSDRGSMNDLLGAGRNARDLMPVRCDPPLRKNESWWLNVPASPPFDETTQRCCNSQRVSIMQCCSNGLHFVLVSLYSFPWLFPSHTD